MATTSREVVIPLYLVLERLTQCWTSQFNRVVDKLDWTQGRATKKVRGLEYIIFDRGGGNWACSAWQRGGWADLTAPCNYLKGSSRADAARLFLVVAADTMRDNIHKSQLEKFWLDIRKNLFPRYSGRGQISWRFSKACLEKAKADLMCSSRRVGEISWGPFLPKVLWSYKIRALGSLLSFSL